MTHHESVSTFARRFGDPADSGIPVDWDTVESWLGHRLPTDYKAIASAYGPLDIGEFLWLHVPCAQEDAFEYGQWVRGALQDAPEGFVPWGFSRATDRFYWDTTGSDDPDRWPVAVFCQNAAYAGADPWLTYGEPLLPTLVALVTEGLALPGGGRLGPLPPTARRTAFLSDLAPGPWTPPAPGPAPTAAQLRALTEGSGLAALTALIPPPSTPLLGGGSWDGLYERLGTRLPADYVELMETYGAGCWTGWLNMDDPLDPGDRGLAATAEWFCDVYRGLRAEHPEYQPLAVWPEPDSLLPFASTIDGDVLGWLATGKDPDEWPLIVAPRHSDQGPPIEGSALTEILLDWHRGRFGGPGFPSMRRVADLLATIGFEPLR